MILDIFIKRPILSLVCSAVIVLAGAVCIPSLPVAQYPDLAPPQIAVATVYTGADARTVEAAVTVPLEKEINGVEGLSYLSSTSSNDGTSLITATFAVGRDPDKASVDVQNRVNAVLGRLPAPVRAAGITVSRTTGDFVFGAGVYAQNNEYDTLFLSNYVDRYVRDNLKRIPGVGSVVIFGERKYSMRLWVDPQKLASRGLTASDVVGALNEQNVEIAAGQIGGPPAIAGQLFQVSVRAVGRLSEPSEFENIILKTAADGTQVRLQDVGRAELGAESYDNVLEFNGRNAVGVAVAQLPGANRLRVYRDCLAELDRLSKRFPPGMKMKLAFDSTQIVAESIDDTVWTLATAILLVVAVMFLFLPDWRATIIPAVAIPVSLVGTLAFVKLLGFSINSLTLFGITLATGLVVDDAILVVENVQRHIAEGGRSGYRAVVKAMREVAGAVVATSFVLVAVFVPVAMLPGTTGILFRQFALTIACSIAISTFTALTLTPALSAALLGGSRPQGLRWRGAVDRAFEGVAARYQSALTALLGRKAAALAIFVAGLGLTYVLYQRVPTGFIPQEDQGFFITMVQAPQGASLEHTARISRQVQQVLSSQPEVVGVFAISGFGFGGNAPNRAVIFAPLTRIGERRGRQHGAAAVIERVRGPLMGIPGAIVVPFAPPAVSGLGNVGGFQMIVQDLRGGTLDDLSRAAGEVIGRASASKSVTQLFSSFSANDPQVVVTIDREKAKRLRVPLTQVSDALQVYMGSTYVNDFDFNNRAYRVYVQADHRFRAEAARIRQLSVRSDTGQMITLDNVVEISQATTAPVISHHNLFRSAEISGAPAPGRASGHAIAAMEASAAAALPQGFAYDWIGLSREEIESKGQSLLLFAAGLLFVYLALAAQYESLSLPFIVILSVPMALLGAFAAVSLRGMVNDVYCQIGLVMLIGLASKNAILIVEFAEQLQARGVPPAEAAIRAAGTRLRPILMTSLAFICGVVPLVTASGAGEAAKQAVGTTVFGGMAVSTVLNLFFTPVLYVALKAITAFGARTIALLRARPWNRAAQRLADADVR
jgi:hydrophobic/amphiphilic exporter-1 (mainly G- bacteria), HAE1 family